MDPSPPSDPPVQEPQKELIQSLFTLDNAVMEKKLIENQKQYSVASLELREAIEEVNDVANAYKYVQNEFENVRMFTQASRSKLDTEKSLLELTKREKKKLIMATEQQNKRRHALEDRLLRSEDMLKACKSKLECLMRSKRMNEERLAVWLDKFGAEEEDVLCYEKFTRLDQAKIKELLLRISNMSEVHSEKRKSFDNEITETKALKFSLNKMIEETISLHSERSALIKRLEKFSDQLAKKEEDIQRTDKMLRDLEPDVERKKRQRSEKEELLASEIEENARLSREIENLYEHRLKLKSEIKEMDAVIVDLAGELKTLRSTLDRTALELELKRAGITHSKEELLLVVERLRRTTAEICRLIKERQMVDVNYHRISEVAENSVSVMKHNEHLKQRVLNELEELHKMDYINEKRILELNDRKTFIATRIEMTKKSYDKARGELRNINKVGLLKMKFLFIKELTAQTMTRKMKMMEGHMLYMEQAALIEQIKMKSAIKDECVKAMLFWSTQTRDVKGGLHRIRSNWERTLALKEDVNRRYNDLVLQINICNKVLQETDAKRKDVLIDESMCRMTVDRLKGILMKRAGEVLTLEKVKEQLECHMNSKKIEMEANRLQFKSRILLAKDMNHELSAEVIDKKLKAEQLMKKYEVLIAFSQSGADGVESITSFAMKSVQEKEELLSIGSHLDESIRKAETELEAMKNAAALIRCSNRNKIQRGVDFDKELEEKALLENQLRKVSVDISGNKKQIRETLENNGKKRSQIEALVLKFQEISTVYQSKEDHWKATQASLQKQERQLRRLLLLFKNRIIKSRGHPNWKRTQKSLEGTIMDNLNERALTSLFDVFDKFPHLESIAHKKMSEHGIDMLTQGGSRSGSVQEAHRVPSLEYKHSRVSFAFPLLFLRKELKIIPVKGPKGYTERTLKHSNVSTFRGPDHMTKISLKKHDSGIGLNVSEFIVKDGDVTNKSTYDSLNNAR